jgi:L-lactate dehydrogenase complex protein LldG
MTSAREAILSSIRKGGGRPTGASSYSYSVSSDELPKRFADKATASVAEVQRIASAADAPEAIFALLSQSGSSMRVHLPENSPLNNLPWQRAPAIMRASTPPSGEDSAFSAADFAIAETGTLVFLSGPRNPSSWHFRPGREIVLVERASILARLEDLFARLGGKLPATLNLVTGPSRTADIEQTIELGAHGPRSLHILVAG